MEKAGYGFLSSQNAEAAKPVVLASIVGSEFLGMGAELPTGE